MITLTIDGHEVTAPKGSLLIEVAQDHGTYIPRFCWHERMKPVGMCRMCLVEVEGVRGLPPACTTPVADGMVVRTTTDEVKKVQDGVLEFLLVNHPLDCPVCDRGGECPLQDQTLAFGPGESRFVEEKRHFEKPIPISDIVLLDRERCIQCARCTRFADEIAGDKLIDFVDRGERMQVLTFPDEPFVSYFSGNTVQICPVGALTAKPYRFRARPWDLETVETSCQTCSVGCRGALQSSSDRLVRLLGVDSEPVNHGWLCDKGRYGIEWVHAESRVTNPMIRKGSGNDAELVESSWPEALDRAADALRVMRDEHGPESIAFLGGARGTNESAYLWARLAKGVIGTDNVDAQLGDGLAAEVVLGVSRAEIADCDTAAGIVLLAPDLKEELPVLYLRLRRAVVELGVPLVEIGSAESGLTRYASAVVRALPGDEPVAVDRFLTALDGGEHPDLASTIEKIRARRGDLVVVLGRPSLATSASVIEAAAAKFAKRSGVRFLSALRRANVHGALDCGLAPGFLPGRVSLDAGRERFITEWRTVPESRGLDATAALRATIDGQVRALVLVGCDPLTDVPDAKLARDGLERAEIVIAVGPYADDADAYADVLLPPSLWGETRGTISNLEGRVLRVGQVVAPAGSTMPDWRIASELAARLGDDPALATVEAIQDELARVAPAFAGVDSSLISRARDGVVLPLADHPVDFSVPGATRVSWEPIPSGQDLHLPAESAPEQAREQQEDLLADAPRYRWDGEVDAASAAVSSRSEGSLRLVVARKLYDAGRVTSLSEGISGLAAGAFISVHPQDAVALNGAERVRLRAEDRVVTLPLVVDKRVQPGTAWAAFAQGGDDRIAELIDAATAVLDFEVSAS